MRKIAVAVSLLIVAGALPALAADSGFPSRKAGEWTVQMVMGGKPMPMGSIKMCLDDATDQKMMDAGLKFDQQKCTKAAPVTNGGVTTLDVTCTLPSGGTTTSHIALTGDFQASYTMKIASDTVGGPAQLPKHFEMTQNGTWAGACPAGMAPGDMLMPGGMKINVLQAMQPGG